MLSQWAALFLNGSQRDLPNLPPSNLLSMVPLQRHCFCSGLGGSVEGSEELDAQGLGGAAPTARMSHGKDEDSKKKEEEVYVPSPEP